jgi:hypothetical protein
MRSLQEVHKMNARWESCVRLTVSSHILSPQIFGFRLNLALIILEYEFHFCSIYLLPSRVLSKNLKVKIYKTLLLPAVLYDCKTWSLTLNVT